jgi:hypothetical protein
MRGQDEMGRFWGREGEGPEIDKGWEFVRGIFGEMINLYLATL